MEELVNKASGMVWSLGLVAFALGAGLFFSIVTRFVQIRYFKEMIKLLFDKGEPESGVSSFQAFCMALAGRVGVGNIAGVATAIAFGGPGAVFWMWIMALLGGASAFVESTLAQVYKVKDGNQYRGGTPYFIEKGLNMKWFGVFVAIVVTLCYGILVPGIQANTIAVGFENTLGLNKSITGIILVALLGIIIFGGVKRIASVADKVVPFMALGYVIVTFVLLIANASEIPAMFGLIISSAFGANEMFGGMIGAAIAWGVKRAVFSNVAGVGEGTYSSAAAAVSHPAKQGLVQAFSVYIDTLVVCTATALMILITGMYSVTPEGQSSIVDNIPGVEAIAIFFFAFTTLMAYYYISETTLFYLGRNRNLKVFKAGLMILFLGMIYIGSVENASLLWGLGDFGFGSMAWLNLVAILMLTKTALKVFKDYEQQRKAGIEPVFDPIKLGIKGADFWEEKVKEGNSRGKKKTEGKQSETENTINF
jgi:AGCS family alanine or glycine:cation symporter